MKRVWQIGLNKAGTVSLAWALGKLGHTPLHDHVIGKAVVQAVRNGEPLPAETEGFTALLDGHYSYCAMQAAEQYPDDLFILNFRAYDAWLTSTLVHVLHNRICHPEEKWQEVDCSERKRVWTQVQGLPARMQAAGYGDRLLVVNVKDGIRWDTLCTFLGLPLPTGLGERLPRFNTGKRRAQELFNAYRG